MRIVPRQDERGLALMITLLLALLVAAMAVGIIMMTGSTNLVAKFHANEAQMKYAADAGLEWARDRLNGSVGLLPANGSVVLEDHVPVRDAAGVVIPNVTRSTYIGPSGNLTGQYGVFASVISVIENQRKAVVVRRSELVQDPFSKYARFFNTWSCCMWGNTEVVFGPLHSNQGMAVQTGAPGATFWGPVTVVAASVTNQGSGNWNGGITTNAAVIPFPTVTTLQNLQTQANTGGTNVIGDARPNAVDPDTRIEFVAFDLNNDGLLTGADEGYFRVFKATFQGGLTAAQTQNRRNYVTARPWLNVAGFTAGGPGVATTPSDASDPNILSPNCGGTPALGGPQPPPAAIAALPLVWAPAESIASGVAPFNGLTPAQRTEAVRRALLAPDRRCFPGGDPRLNAGTPTSPKYRTVEPAHGGEPAGNSYGQWLTWPGWGGNPPAALVNYFNGPGAVLVDASTNANQLAGTFWPLSRGQNINFKGVIYVTGSIAISGQLRGRVTVVATGNVTLPDDINYVSAPNTDCSDILGVLTPQDALVENNSINRPFNVKGAWTVAFDDTPNEIFNAFFLTLGTFRGESFGGDPAVIAPENCGGKSRGCKSIVGGTIQQGIAATFTGNSGWAEQDTFDQCGVNAPPPYYPTTGHFRKNRYYEIDPVGFDVGAWFAANQ